MIVKVRINLDPNNVKPILFQGQTETEPAAKATSQDPMFRCLNCKETFLSPNQLKLHWLVKT